MGSEASKSAESEGSDARIYTSTFNFSAIDRTLTELNAERESLEKQGLLTEEQAEALVTAHHKPYLLSVRYDINNESPVDIEIGISSLKLRIVVPRNSHVSLEEGCRNEEIERFIETYGEAYPDVLFDVHAVSVRSGMYLMEKTDCLLDLLESAQIPYLTHPSISTLKLTKDGLQKAQDYYRQHILVEENIMRVPPVLYIRRFDEMDWDSPFMTEEPLDMPVAVTIGTMFRYWYRNDVKSTN